VSLPIGSQITRSHSQSQSGAVEQRGDLKSEFLCFLLLTIQLGN